MWLFYLFFFFFFNDTATTEIYTLSLHDALPIFRSPAITFTPAWPWFANWWRPSSMRWSKITSAPDRKSTRLNSSHVEISYAVFCLKKKKKKKTNSDSYSDRKGNTSIIKQRSRIQ